jgi:3-deoxy-D-manno-octulosonate 8-phosphate phosphatase KdsC-like HAD superfamily phosphatase
MDQPAASPSTTSPRSARKASKTASPGGGSATGNARWGKLETELRRLDPKSLKRRDKNARYMSPEEFSRLVENVRIDGKLTSAVLACQEPDGGIEILSGHHRTAAAIEVGIPEIDVIVITSKLSEERKAAIQLSHNAVSGKDDPSILAELYRDLGIDAKMFSGLTDDILDVSKLNISGLNANALSYDEIRLAFLPEDREKFDAALSRMKTDKKILATHALRFRDFDTVFDAAIAVKEKRNILNSALAFLVMAELAMAKLAEES